MARMLRLLGAIVLLSGCDGEKVYSEGCEPVPANWISPREGRGMFSFLDVVHVASNGIITWNGKTIKEPQLRKYLSVESGFDPAPVVQIKFEPEVPCETVIRLRNAMAASLNCDDGTCAEGSGRMWIISDIPPFEAFDPHPELPQGTN